MMFRWWHALRLWWAGFAVAIPGTSWGACPLGWGYSAERNRCLTQVLDSDVGLQFYGSEQGSLDLSTAMTFRDLTRSLDARLAGRARVMALPLEAKIDFAAAMAETETSLNWVLKMSSSGLRVRLARVAVRFGLRQALAGMVTPQQLELLGDRVVTSLGLAVSYHAAAKLRFTSQHSKRTFKEQVGLDLSAFLTADQQAEVRVEPALRRAQLTLRAFQEGGDTTALFSLLSQHVLECQVADLEPCRETFRNMIAYGEQLRRSLPHGLRTQRDGQLLAATRDPEMNTYGELGILPTSLDVARSVAEPSPLATALEQDYWTLSEDRSEVDAALGYAILPADSDRLRALRRQITEQMEQIRGLLLEEATLSADAFAQRVSSHYVAWFPQAGQLQPAWVFENLCRYSTDRVAQKTVRRTLQALAQVLGTEPSCAEARRVLADLDGLDLSWREGEANERIESLAPLGDLTHFERLTLSDNAITRLDELEAFTQLRELVADGNVIGRFPALAGLNHLRLLDLSRNPQMELAADKLAVFVNHPELELVALREVPLQAGYLRQDELSQVVAAQLQDQGNGKGGWQPGRNLFVTGRDVLLSHLWALLGSEDRDYVRDLLHRDLYPVGALRVVPVRYPYLGYGPGVWGLRWKDAVAPQWHRGLKR